MQALISENSSECDAVIYTDRCVVRHGCSAWARTAQIREGMVKEDSGALDYKQSDYGGCGSHMAGDKDLNPSLCFQ